MFLSKFPAAFTIFVQITTHMLQLLQKKLFLSFGRRAHPRSGIGTADVGEGSAVKVHCRDLLLSAGQLWKALRIAEKENQVVASINFTIWSSCQQKAS